MKCFLIEGKVAAMHDLLLGRPNVFPVGMLPDECFVMVGKPLRTLLAPKPQKTRRSRN